MPAVCILRGFKTVIKVHPTSVISDDAIKDLDIEVRKCRFEDEIPESMILFKEYSPSACRFQCMYNFR